MDPITDATTAQPSAPAETGGGEAATPTVPSQASQDPQVWGGWLEEQMAANQEPGEEQPTEAASGGVTPDGEFADLHEALGDDPRKEAFLNRLNELSSQRKELEAQLGQFQALQDWQSAVEAMATVGYTPQQIVQWLQAAQGGQAAGPQAPQATPEQQFEAFATAQGIDLAYADEPMLRALKAEFRVAQIETQLQRQQEAAQRAHAEQQARAYEAQVAAEIQALTSNPEDPLRELWANPQMQAVLRLAHGELKGEANIRAIAAEIAKPILAQQQAQLARYAAGKQQDAKVPVVAGGSAPPPVQTINPHRMNPTQEQAVWQSAFEALSAQP